MSLHCTLPCELRSGDFLEPGKPADLWECSLGFSKNSEVFLVGNTTLYINSCVHYLLGLTATLTCSCLKRSLRKCACVSRQFFEKPYLLLFYDKSSLDLAGELGNPDILEILNMQPSTSVGNDLFSNILWGYMLEKGGAKRNVSLQPSPYGLSTHDKLAPPPPPPLP